MATYDSLVKDVEGALVKCADDVDGPCYQEQHGKAVILFEDYKSCQGSWLLLPGFDTLPRGLLIVVYSLFFAWIFFGVSIASDRFMAGIEVICALKRKVKKKNPKTGEMVELEVPVWNWVVANISLMALGTSAPEILLATVETVMSLGSVPGELGPSCIVGSAAYNFFVISAVCTLSLKNGEFKRIEQFRVFICTAVWSIWAYIWMYLVYKVISPNVIEMWEAFVTLGFFPALILTAWLIDTEPWKGDNTVFPDEEEAAGKGGDAAAMHDKANPVRKSILHYRMLAVRKLAGESRADEMLKAYAQQDPHASKHLQIEAYDSNLRQLSGHAVAWNSLSDGNGSSAGKMQVGFGSMHYSVLESSGAARIVVKRSGGDLASPLTVQFATKDGTAVAGLDYEHAQGALKFAAGEEEKEVMVPILDDDMSEPDVTFSVELTGAEGAAIVQASVPVTIVDDDEGGVLMFEVPTLQVSPNQPVVELPVVRRNGADGNVSVDWATKDGTAVQGAHFAASQGTLHMARGETRGTIAVPLMGAAGKAGMAAFKVELTNPLGGAVLGSRTECRVIITPSARPHTSAQGGKGGSGSKAGGAAGGSGGDGEEAPFHLWSAWGDEVKEAIMPQIESEGWEAWVDLALHYICITWKLVLCLVPPAEWLGGYPCFIIAMALLVGIVAIMKEVAELFGCMVGLSDLMTGISLVALGTSIPDTFASRYAAMNDDTADAAIGNVTGSNSVNVFLGLGLPWVIACIYHKVKGEQYVVAAGPLGFSLVVFCCGFAGALTILMVQRYRGGELGGSRATRWTVALTLLSIWFLFLALAGSYDSGHFESKV
uniref:Calx-beta domain-containing protein n=1 Tax=Chlamydomonas leiostraca TaxID=1034604 RepID=A0A7S0WQC5_9CHLO|mmetsp:Transcript_23344/g.59747  ORF Transcript_23344/g.59747 Transcript_23344/m.59747 type:complete len:827 (+) Transcript_23344:97-2577(+)|eukprot:CAMPEP_0202876640 /NCGR_PEP_ID=MMETSP1391-20130828/29326_1 /ASSEMBLY_ACC=CAM_ASM_000867 /TAXON_ID=1034604 /ORGANISM="Chlamydomonas leiostraca, Strain SAG 11-49" /LENGTH=826 /DNA_ID=CAMNT_0049558535 /DNA_START=48 /DNA_END=2528 /DNA_ORIENTATION=+